MKDFLKKLIQRKKDEQDKLNKRMEESEDIKEVRSIGETLKTIAQEIAEAEAQLQAIENEPKNEPQEEKKDDEARADDNLDPNEEEPTNENVERSSLSLFCASRSSLSIWLPPLKFVVAICLMSVPPTFT